MRFDVDAAELPQRPARPPWTLACATPPSLAGMQLLPVVDELVAAARRATACAAASSSAPTASSGEDPLTAL